MLDIRPLTRKGTGPIDCGPPSVINDPITGFTTSFVGHNNGASDCPVEVGVLNVDSALNFSSHGGPHSLQLDDEERRFSFSNYFVDLQGFGLPGTGTSGDLKVFMANFNRHNGHASIDTAFRDELTNETGVNFNRPASYSWPGEVDSKRDPLSRNFHKRKETIMAHNEIEGNVIAEVWRAQRQQKRLPIWGALRKRKKLYVKDFRHSAVA